MVPIRSDCITSEFLIDIEKMKVQKSQTSKIPVKSCKISITLISMTIGKSLNIGRLCIFPDIFFMPYLYEREEYHITCIAIYIRACRGSNIRQRVFSRYLLPLEVAPNIRSILYCLSKEKIGAKRDTENNAKIVVFI